MDIFDVFGLEIPSSPRQGSGYSAPVITSPSGYVGTDTTPAITWEPVGAPTYTVRILDADANVVYENLTATSPDTVSPALDQFAGPFTVQVSANPGGAVATSEFYYYNTKLLNIINWNALWPLAETSGTNAADIAGGGYDGTSTNVTWNNSTFLDGTPAPLFVPASASRIATYNATLAAAINKQEGTFACWVQMRNAGVWSDGIARWLYDLRSDGNNRIGANKSTAANTLQYRHFGSSTFRQPNVTVSTTDWFHLAFTFDGAATIAYVNGVAVATQAAPGVFAGAVLNTSMVIGALTTAGDSPHDGSIRYLGFGEYATAAQILDMATV